MKTTKKFACVALALVFLMSLAATAAAAYPQGFIRIADVIPDVVLDIPLEKPHELTREDDKEYLK